MSANKEHRALSGDSNIQHLIYEVPNSSNAGSQQITQGPLSPDSCS